MQNSTIQMQLSKKRIDSSDQDENASYQQIDDNDLKSDKSDDYNDPDDHVEVQLNDPSIIEHIVENKVGPSQGSEDDYSDIEDQAD